MTTSLAAPTTAAHPAPVASMAHGDTRRDWLPANPWCWMIAGLILCGVVWTGTLLGEPVGVGRFALLSIGILFVGTAVMIRLKSPRPSFLEGRPRFQRNFTLTALTLLFLAMAVSLSVLLILAFMRPASVPWRWGPLLVAWIVTAPMCELAMRQSFRRLWKGEPLSDREEKAAMLLLAALACFVATRALYDQTDPLNLDTLREFCGVLTLIPLVAAPLVLIPRTARRQVIGGLVLLHFAGITTATLSIPPNPLAVSQLWSRIYRPYLEFFVINNAYHFYAPDPGPLSHIWFRVFYEKESDGSAAPPEWFKVPRLDENDRSTYPMGVTFQRTLVLTEDTTPQEPTAFFQANGASAPFVQSRSLHMPVPVATTATAVVGTLGTGDYAIFYNLWDFFRREPGSATPWHPDLPLTLQYLPPTSDVKRYIRSYALHVMEIAAKPGLRVRSVKVYRVLHQILPTATFSNGIFEPGDPDTYRATYFGEYNPQGKLVNEEDPLLYWLLPTVRQYPLPDSPIRCYVRRHAGDPLWQRNERKQWVDDLPPLRVFSGIAP